MRFGIKQALQYSQDETDWEYFFPFFYLWVPLINAADIINFILRPHSAALGRRSVTKMKLLWHTALFEISLFFPNTALEFFIQCRFTLEFSRAAQHPTNGLKTKLYPHQSILIREINITHTTPKSKPPPLQTNPTQTTTTTNQSNPNISAHDVINY